jgi:uncharacterized protein YodC (DUF2158 family)
VKIELNQVSYEAKPMEEKIPTIEAIRHTGSAAQTLRSQTKVKPLFAVGEVVYLKSGGPKLTVVMVESFDEMQFVYSVAWFAGEELKRDGFLENMLQR